VRRLLAGVVVFGRHRVLPFVGSAAPIAAFMATKGGGRTGPAPRSEASGRSEAEDGGGAGYSASRCKGGLPPTENSRPAAIAGPGRLLPRSPSQKAVGAVLSDNTGKHHDPMRHETRAAAGLISPFRLTPPVP
jgi:hypothetical protein